MTQAFALAARDLRRLKQIEAFGVMQAHKAGALLRKQATLALRNNTPIDVGDAFIKVLQPILEKAMLASHAQATSIVYGRAKRNGMLRLSFFDEVITALDSFEFIDTERLAYEYKTQAFTILKGESETINQELRGTISTLVQEGAPVKEGIQVLNDKLDSMGLSPVKDYRLETIFRTNTQTAFNAGRWQATQDPAIQEILWGYEYVTVGDDRVREEHAVLDGTKLPKDDPFWKTWWPPNGWNCRCQVIEIFTGDNEARVKEPKEIPVPDSDFGFNPGELLTARMPAMMAPRSTTQFLSPAQVKAFNEARKKGKAADIKTLRNVAREATVTPPVVAPPKPTPPVVAPPKPTPPVVAPPKPTPPVVAPPKPTPPVVAPPKPTPPVVAPPKPTYKSSTYKAINKSKQGVSKVKAALKELDIVEQRFPKLHKYLRTKPVPTILFKDSLPDNSGGIYFLRTNAIHIDATMKSTRIKTIRFGAYNVDDSIPGAVRHELGHHVHLTLMDDAARKDWFFSMSRAGRLDKAVSKYADTDAREAFAETFSVYTHPAYTRGSLPQPIEKFFDKYIGDVDAVAP